MHHNDLLLANEHLSEEQRVAGLVQRATCLARLDRYDDARQALATIPASPANAAIVALTSGTILLDEIDATVRKLPASEQSQAIAAMADKLNAALADFEKARSLDAQKSKISQQASYQMARGLALNGDTDGALKQFLRTRQLYGDSIESLAAGLGEADVLRKKGDFEAALPAYRRALDSFAAIPVYRSLLLPVGDIRERTMAALKDYLEHQQYKEALSLIEHLAPLYSRAEQLELRGDALERWGTWQVNRAAARSRGVQGCSRGWVGTFARGWRRVRATCRVAICDQVLHVGSLAGGRGLLPRAKLFAGGQCAS